MVQNRTLGCPMRAIVSRREIGKSPSLKSALKACKQADATLQVETDNDIYYEGGEVQERAPEVY